MSKPRKRCLYCDLDKTITKSDIIPKTLTNKTIKYHSVCQEHNEGIGNLYEDSISKKLALLRRLFDIPSRKNKEDITYRVRFILSENNVIEFTNFSGIAEAFWHGLEGIALNGDKKKLKIASKDESDIQILEKITIEFCEFKDLVKTLTDLEMFKLIAKIGYEYYCKSNRITGFDKTQFGNIVKFILDINYLENNFVEIVTDWNLYDDLNKNIEYGSHALFIMTTTDGKEYVVFSLWGIIVYKIFIKKWSLIFPYTLFSNYFACRYDGSLPKFELTTLGGSKEIHSTSNINDEMRGKIYKNIEAVFKYSLFTKEGKRREISRIKNVLNSTRELEDKMFYLVGAQDQEVICFCYAVLLLYEIKNFYDSSINFNKNIKSIFENNEFLHISPDEYTNIVIKMGEEVFIETLKKAVDFFEKTK